MRDKLEQHGITMMGDIRGPYRVVVPLSGGKDSQCCLKLALQEYQAHEVLAYFCDTKYEHPFTYAHVDKLSAEYGIDLVKLNAGSVLEVCTKYKRFPGGGARHCTDELKIRPAKYFYKYLAEQQGGFEVWLGLRSDESKEREARYRNKVCTDLYAPNDVMKKYPKYLKKLGVMFKLPILDWAKSEVFEFLEGKENPLYTIGFDRVGCFPCLEGGEKFQMMAFHFDEVGRKHFQIAEQIAEVAGREVLRTKKYAGQGPGCALCCI
jgi:3'-phosphoadenosine 5'-phosphosulfate sulfotransferase (PAPS reductase)/FAD synthetase